MTNAYLSPYLVAKKRCSKHVKQIAVEGVKRETIIGLIGPREEFEIVSARII